MTKKRRTRKEKIHAPSKNNSLNLVFSAPVEEKQSTNIPTISPKHDYSYILKESKNTLFITAVITAVNLFIFIALKQNYINLFGIEF